MHVVCACKPCSMLQAAYQTSIVRGRTDRTSIGEAICNKASDLSVSLVVMAAHNRGAMIRFIIGSTTQYCIEHCDTTVLVFQGHEHGKAVSF